MEDLKVLARIIVALMLMAATTLSASDSATELDRPEIVEVIKKTAVPTAQVELEPPHNVKFLSLRVAPNGEALIVETVRGSGNHVDLCRSGIDATVRWNTKEMQPEPQEHDYEAAESQNCAFYIVSADGKQIRRIYVIDGRRGARLFTVDGA